VKIISGGQTGADRGALDAAMASGVEHGGWCPRGRLAEDGAIPTCYQLTETETPEYPARTERNVRQSDGTLIVHRGPIGGGTELTLRLAQQHGKPYLLVDLDAPLPAEEVARWIGENTIEVLNVAGPRESQSPGIAAETRAFVDALLAELNRD
jgi:hypothetical protein